MDESESKIMSKDLSMSFSSLKTKKLGRKISRSMSIVGMNPLLSRRSSKARRSPTRSRKGTWTFELAVIAPDKTQKQVEVLSSQKIADIVKPVLQEFGLQLEECASSEIKTEQKQGFMRYSRFKKDHGKVAVQSEDCVDSITKFSNAGLAIALLGGSRAPVNQNASAALLDGELLVLQMQAPPWDGVDLACFLLSEREYASTVGSAIELYAKPLLKAEILTKREYHVLFYHLHCVSEASKSLCERLQSYMDAGLLNISQKQTDSSGSDNETECQPEVNKSILDEMVQEGFLKQSDLETSKSEQCLWDKNELNDVDDVDGTSEKYSSLTPKIILSDFDAEKQSEINSFNSLPVTAVPNDNKPKLNDVNGSIILNLQWEFIDKPGDDRNKRFMNMSMNDIFNEYDSVAVGVKRSSSDSRILSAPASEDGIYESLEDISNKRSNAATPYESIEDLYECIKNQSMESEKEFQIKRCSSEKSLKSGSGMSFNDSKIDDEYTSTLFPNRRNSSESDTKSFDEKDENKILLNQLINGDLMDVYFDYLTGYTKARIMLREKMKNDEHFAALVEIRRGAAKYSIADYLELPIERLAQYERLAGSGDAGARRRGQRLSDLERVQDLFPNDFLALHEHDVVAATAGTLKSKNLIRKRPSLDAALGINPNPGSPGCNNGPRQFVMEAPCLMAPAPVANHLTPNSNSSPTSANSTPTQDRHLFLFTDLLLVAKSRGNNSFKLKEAVRLSEVWVSSGNTDTTFLLGWAGSTTLTTYVLTYPTQAARDSWFRKIQNALNNQLAFEPKTTNVQILYKDNANAIEFSKTLSITPEMTTALVIRQALQLVQGGVSPEGNPTWGPARDFCLWARTSRDSAPLPLIGCERPHAIQMSRIRQTLSNEEGFDLEHVNSKNNPCGMVFDLRKINRSVIKTRTPLKLFRRSSGRLFGISLVRLCPNGALPAAVLTMLRVLHRRGPQTQGIFRKSANAKALKHLREKVDNAGAAGGRCAELDSAPVLLVASLLKDFLRSLPQPLMCDSLYANWISILTLNTTEKTASMRSLLLKLPKAHYNLLSHFVALLQAIARKTSINLMCPMNLAVCVGPSLLWPTIPCDTAPKAVPALIELLIINAEVLFGPHLHNIFGKGSPEPSASLSLDSGAEESDSLHSVGLSLDSLDLTCTRKEKLSLSRDSGLTLSEDDSNSNGGNSPAPRNGQTNQILPQTGIQTHQAQRVYAKCYNTDTQNGLPNPSIGNYDVVKNKNIFVKTADVDLYAQKYAHEKIYGTNPDVQKTIENQQKIYDSIAAQNRYNTNFHDSQGIYGTSQNHIQNNHLTPKNHPNGLLNQSSPSKFLTGYEPEKPPRLGINRANRNAKVYSVHIENTIEQRPPPNRVFCRAKSSDDLLEKRTEKGERNPYALRGSQENIYGNLTYENRPQQIKSKIQRNPNMLDSCKLEPPLQSYSRVYGGWEQRVLNYTNSNHRQNNVGYANDTFVKSQKINNNENVYEVTPTSHPASNSIHVKQECENTPTSATFTRRDWTRQASRTKSLDVSGVDIDSYQDEDADENMHYIANNSNEFNHRNCNNSTTCQCNMRSIDPAHACSKKCQILSNVNNENVDLSHRSFQHSKISSPKQIATPEFKKNSIIPKVNSRKAGHSSKYEKSNQSNKLVHSKSLANIVLHSDSSSSDTLYQSTNYLKQNSPASSNNSFTNNYNNNYTDEVYTVSRKKNDLDIFCENIYGRMGSREGIYSSDIYTAKPTSIGSYNSDIANEKNQPSKRNAIMAPPVPPRKVYHNTALKNLPPVHLIGDENKTRSKSVPSVYQEQIQETKTHPSSESKSTAGVRAPITSYHIGNSNEKFILALEDSGTDTESESYV